MCKGSFVTAGLIVGFNISVSQIWRWYHGTAEQLEWLNDWLLAESYIYITTYILCNRVRIILSDTYKYFLRFAHKLYWWFYDRQHWQRSCVCSASSDTSSSLRRIVFYIRDKWDFLHFYAEVLSVKGLNVQNLHTVIILLWQIYWAVYTDVYLRKIHLNVRHRSDPCLRTEITF